jgi:hypothetical protein
MTTTTMTEAMTAADLFAECNRLRAAFGPKAEVHLMVQDGRYGAGDTSVYLSVRPTGEYNRDSPYLTYRGRAWADAFSTAHKDASSYFTVLRNATIRKLALAIIEITDEHGHCTEVLLLSKGFPSTDIADFHVDACVRASEMCANAPFRVVFQ